MQAASISMYTASRTLTMMVATSTKALTGLCAKPSASVTATAITNQIPTAMTGERCTGCSRDNA